MDSEIDLSLTYLSLLASSIWIFNRGFYILKKVDLYQESLNWLESKPILIPVIAFFSLPLFILYVESKTEIVRYFISPVISVSTFILGQYLAKRNQKSEEKSRTKQALEKVNNILRLNSISLNKQLSVLECIKIIGEHQFIDQSLLELRCIDDDFSGIDWDYAMSESLLKPDQVWKLQSEISLKIQEYNSLLTEKQRLISEYNDLSRDKVKNVSQSNFSSAISSFKLNQLEFSKIQSIKVIESNLYEKNKELCNLSLFCHFPRIKNIIGRRKNAKRFV